MGLGSLNCPKVIGRWGLEANLKLFLTQKRKATNCLNNLTPTAEQREQKHKHKTETRNKVGRNVGNHSNISFNLIFAREARKK